MKISFFFPAYHDEATIEPLIDELERVLPTVAEEHEIIVIDDASPDRAGEIADRIARDNPRVRVVHHPRNRGYGQAVWSGILAARHEWICFTDGDMQYDVAELPRLVAEARRGADVVVGYKTERAEGWRRALTSRLYNTAVRAALGLPVRDVDCAFKLMRRDALADFAPSVHYHEAFILVEALYKAHERGARIVEVPVSHRARRAGQSTTFNLRTARRLAWNTARAAIVGRVLGQWR